MKKGLMNNWGLKILSFLLAVMLWLIVVNIDDPVTMISVSSIALPYKISIPYRIR